MVIVPTMSYTFFGRFDGGGGMSLTACRGFTHFSGLDEISGGTMSSG